MQMRAKKKSKELQKVTNGKVGKPDTEGKRARAFPMMPEEFKAAAPPLMTFTAELISLIKEAFSKKKPS